MSPREYARQILAMSTIEERRAALENVPEGWRELVATHVMIAWNHPKGGKAPQLTGAKTIGQ